MFNLEYGDRIAQLRERKGMTQEELAGSIGITRAALSHYEKNRREPDYKTLSKIADYFKVSIDWIIRGNNLSAPNDPKYSSLELTLEEEYAKKGLSPETQRELLDVAVAAVEEARKKHNKRRK